MDCEKPLKCKYPNCFNCPYADCKYDLLTIEDVLRQDNFDKELIEPEVLKRRERQKRYDKSGKGIERTKRYNKTDKAKERWKRYYRKKKQKKVNKRKE